MHSPVRLAARAASRACVSVALAAVFFLTAIAVGVSGRARAQWDDEQSISLNAMMKLQAGMFVPLASDKFRPQENTAELRNKNFPPYDPCDPIVRPMRPCVPTNHGKKPGSASIARATLQVEAHWDFNSKVALHAIFRAVRSARLAEDEWGQPQTMLLPDQTPRSGHTPSIDSGTLRALRGEYAQDFVHDNYYEEIDLREFYLDWWPSDFLSFRIGRQQVAWGETGSFRLLDVVNPSNNLWHFGPLESFEDQRIPLWMGLATIEIPPLRSALELLYIPGVDRARDTVNAPLTFGGAWGLPYSSSPPTFQIIYRDLQYPGGKIRPEYMRGGMRLKGVLGDNGGYSLVYMANHMMNPILSEVRLAPDGMGGFDSSTATVAELKYPRTHIVGGSFEWTIPSPVASTLRFEAAADLKHRWSPNVSLTPSEPVPGTLTWGNEFIKPEFNWAFVFQRPTMIRWLNPTQNFLLVAQVRARFVNVRPEEGGRDSLFVNTITYNDWNIQRHSVTFIGHARTSYAHGIFEPRLTGAFILNPYYENSGFITLDLGFRVGPHYRFNFTITDFFGGNPYRDAGLFRDRDELHGSFAVLF